MPVGNDVVDLRHPHCQPGAIHARFDTRAFTASEIALLAASAEAHRTRWSLWAAKESAFKVCRKLDPRVRFLPRDFAVRLSGERAEVVHRGGCFEVWLDHTEQWVHALASQAGEKPDFRLEGDLAARPDTVEELSGERVRELARSTVGAALGCAPDELRIVSEHRVPRVQRRGEPVPVDLSLSHDGRFAACAWEMR